MPFLVLYLIFLFFSNLSCTILATRPLQEMSLTASALRAAHEVKADTLAPELFHQASDLFDQAKYEYRFKNFDLAREYSIRARGFAERAEFASLQAGASRQEEELIDPMTEPVEKKRAQLDTGPKYPPYEYPSPSPIPFDDLEQKRMNDLKAATPSTPSMPAPAAAAPAPGR